MSRLPNPPFAVQIPKNRGPIVVEVPHASLGMMDEIAAGLTRVPPPVLAADVDIAADELFADVVQEDAVLVVATISRFIIDLNTTPRLPTPYEDRLPYGLREVRRRSANGQVWFESPPPRAEVERRIRDVFEPYHAEIAEHLAFARARHGVAVLVSAHSYPDTLFPNAADVVIGTRGGESVGSFIAEAASAVVRAEGLSVSMDDPFPGGYAIERHGRPAEGVHALQIEIARRLFCDRGAVVSRPNDIRHLRPLLRRIIGAIYRAALQPTSGYQNRG